MVKLTLVIHVAFGKTENDGYEGFLKKTFIMPTLPRVGEELGLEKDISAPFKVSSVVHLLVEGVIEVCCNNNDYGEHDVLNVVLVNEKSWEYESGFPANTKEAEIDKKKFFDALKEYKEKILAKGK